MLWLGVTSSSESNKITGCLPIVYQLDKASIIAKGLYLPASVAGLISSDFIAAPELLAGSAFDEQADVWACGIIMAYMLLLRLRRLKRVHLLETKDA